MNYYKDEEINSLYINIRELIEHSRNKVYKTVNVDMINLYWNIGKMIVENKREIKELNMGIILLKVYQIN